MKERKVLKDINGVDYLLLNEFDYKGILCVFACNVNDENDKSFFQISSDENKVLIKIESQKMLNDLNNLLFIESTSKELPRKIKENESIEEYFTFLEDFYKTKVVTDL